jgi:uncharacterized protein (TIGR02391 family)
MTLPKHVLKNMFLLSLYANIAPQSSLTYAADSIIPSLNRGELTEEETALAWEGFEELKREGIIMQNPKLSQSPLFTILTSKGKEVLRKIQKKGTDFSDFASGLDLEDVAKNKGLINACKVSFEGGNYWNAVFEAARHLETRVRAKGEFLQTDITDRLMTKAFHPDKGKLKIPSCKAPAEELGFYEIIRGISLFHRNPKGHDESEDFDRNHSLKIIGYIDYLLDIIESAENN